MKALIEVYKKSQDEVEVTLVYFLGVPVFRRAKKGESEKKSLPIGFNAIQDGGTGIDLHNEDESYDD